MHPPFPCEVGGVQRIETVEGRSSIDLLSPPQNPLNFLLTLGLDRRENFLTQLKEK